MIRYGNADYALASLRRNPLQIFPSVILSCKLQYSNTVNNSKCLHLEQFGIAKQLTNVSDKYSLFVSIIKPLSKFVYGVNTNTLLIL